MLNAPTILLVEDDEADALFMGVALKKSGFTYFLQTVPDGEQAIRYLAGEGEFSDRAAHPVPRLVLLDLGLPHKSGLDVLDWITHHAEPTDYAVVMLSGSDQPSKVLRAYEAGALSFFVKPDTLGELVELVKGFKSYLTPAFLRSPTFEHRSEPSSA